jgi:hypothetical protein
MQAPAGLPSPDKQIVGSGQSYQDWMREYFQIHKIPKKNAIRLGNSRVRPNRMIGVVMEVVGEDDDSLYVRNLPLEDPESAAFGGWKAREAEQVFLGMKQDYFKDKYLIADQSDVPPPFTDRLAFVRSGTGLPTGGRWQMGFDIADMNGDGLPDLVFGPQRTGPPALYIFLQQKDGSFQSWQGVKWPTKGLKLDYGTVRVADFDGDGNKDIAIACHFSKTYVLYGNGKGDFTRFIEVPQTNPNVTSRSLAVADFNGDGRPDLATMDELDLVAGTGQTINSGLVNIALNLPEGWKAVGKGDFPKGIQGDWITAGDVFGDGKFDLLLTSRAQNVMDLVYRNRGDGEKWESVASLSMPVNAFVYANAVAPLDRFAQPDLVQCFSQYNPWKVEPPTQACVIYRFHDAAGKPVTTPIPTVLFQEKSGTISYTAVAVGDLDGDGRNDIVVGSSLGTVRVFLQGKDGTFYEQRKPGMDQPGTAIFDIKIAKMGPGRDASVIFAGSPSATAGGGVWLYDAVKPRTGTVNGHDAARAVTPALVAPNP